MNILKRISKLFSKTKLFTSGNSLITGMELQAPSTKDYLESFRASALVHSCTKKIGEKMSTIEYELYQLRGLKAHYLEQHDVLDLLEKPNPITSGSQLVEITSIYLSLLGDCYWYKARGLGKQVVELWLMRPDLVSVVPSKDGSVVAYKFRSGGKETSYPVEDVIHFKEPDPLSDYYGFSAIKSAMEVIRADVYAKKWNTRFFYNSARPDAILTTSQEIGKEDREEIREKWSTKYGGWENAQKVAVLSHGLDYKQVSVTQKDMDFANMRIANRDDILMALGVPKSVIGVTDDVNRANAEAGIYVFLSETIKPKMEKFVDILNQFLVNEFGDNLFISSIDPTPGDKASLDDHYVKAHNKWITTNEIRIAEGYDPIDGGDFIYQTISLQPMGEDKEETGDEKIIKIGKGFSAEKVSIRKKEERLKEIYRKAIRGRKLLRLQENLINDITIKVATAITKTQKRKTVTKQYDKDAIWKTFDNFLKSWEKKWQTMDRKLFKAQKARALKALKKLKINSKVEAEKLGLLNLKKETKLFSKTSKPIITTIVKEAGDLALKQVGKKSIKKDFDIEDPVTAEWIDKKAMKFGVEVNETTIQKLKSELSAGVLEGESIPKLAKRVDRLFNMWYKGRDKTIARTEVLSSNNAGTLFGYEQSEVVSKKEWLATRDTKTRDTHIRLDGEKVGTKKKFSNGLNYPGDPEGDPGEIINCRCTIIPVVK